VKRLAWLTAAALATVAGVFVLWAFRGTVLLFLLSLAVAAAVRPVVDSQIKPGRSRSLALLLVYGLALGLLVLLVALGSVPLSQELERIGSELVTRYTQLWTRGQTSPAQPPWFHWLPPPQELFSAVAGGRGVAAVESALGVTLSVFGLAGQAVAVLILSVYWALDQARFERLGLSLLPPEQRAPAREIWHKLELTVGAHIRSEAVQSVLAGLLLALCYRLIGLDYPVILALIGAVARLIPWLGFGVAVVPVILIGGANPGLVVLAVVYTLLVFALLEYVLEPRLFDRRRYSSLLVVLLMLALAELWGLVGVLIAPPLATALQTLFAQFVHQTSAGASGQIVEQIADVEQRLESVREVLSASGSPLPPQTLSLVGRLEKLVERSNEVLEDGRSARPAALDSG
jgi:predicted PurR-regulated permease PerM